MSRESDASLRTLLKVKDWHLSLVEAQTCVTRAVLNSVWVSVNRLRSRAPIELLTWTKGIDDSASQERQGTVSHWTPETEGGPCRWASCWPVLRSRQWFCWPFQEVSGHSLFAWACFRRQGRKMTSPKGSKICDDVLQFMEAGWPGVNSDLRLAEVKATASLQDIEDVPSWLISRQHAAQCFQVTLQAPDAVLNALRTLQHRAAPRPLVTSILSSGCGLTDHALSVAKPMTPALQTHSWSCSASSIGEGICQPWEPELSSLTQDGLEALPELCHRNDYLVVRDWSSALTLLESCFNLLKHYADLDDSWIKQPTLLCIQSVREKLPISQTGWTKSLSRKAREAQKRPSSVTLWIKTGWLAGLTAGECMH